PEPNCVLLTEDADCPGAYPNGRTVHEEATSCNCTCDGSASCPNTARLYADSWDCSGGTTIVVDMDDQCWNTALLQAQAAEPAPARRASTAGRRHRVPVEGRAGWFAAEAVLRPLVSRVGITARVRRGNWSSRCGCRARQCSIGRTRLRLPPFPVAGPA